MTSTREDYPLSDALKNRFNQTLFLSYYTYLELKAKDDGQYQKFYPEELTEREIEQRLKSYYDDPDKEPPTHPAFNEWFDKLIKNERQRNKSRVQTGLFEGLFFDRNQRFIRNHENLCKAYVYYRFMNEFYEQKRLHADYSSRFRSDWPQPFTGRATAEAMLWQNRNNTDPNSTLIEVNIVGNAAGFILGIIIDYIVRPFYPVRKPLDPWYRICKTMACLGQFIGNIIALLIPAPFGIDAPRKIVAALFGFALSLVFGLLPILWFPIQMTLNWGFRACFNWEPFPLPTDESQTNWQIGKEGVSKYGKAGLVWGAALFSTLAAALFFTTSLFTPMLMHFKVAGLSNSLLFVMSVGASVGGVFLFTAVVIAVPLYNYWKRTPVVNTRNSIEEENDPPAIPLNFSKNKHDFRNNYPRAGITLFSAIFSLIGALLCVYVFPLFGILSGLSLVAGLTLGAAVGGTIGGPLFIYIGKDISQYFIDKWNTPYDTDNNWDYAMRTMCNFGFFVGTFIGFIPYFMQVITGGTLLGAASTVPIGVAFIGPMICGAIGNIVGAALGLAVVCIARTVQKNEKKSEELHWSQRLNDRANKGATFFGVTGLLIGLIFFAPGGLMAAAIWGSTASALGGSLGMIWGSFDDKTARETWWKLWDYLRGRNTDPDINQQSIAVALPTETPVSHNVTIAQSVSYSLLSDSTTVVPSPPSSPIRDKISRESSGNMAISSPSSRGSPVSTHAQILPDLTKPIMGTCTRSQTPLSPGKMSAANSDLPSPVPVEEEEKCYQPLHSAPSSPLSSSSARFRYASTSPRGKGLMTAPSRRPSLGTAS